MSDTIPCDTIQSPSWYGLFAGDDSRCLKLLNKTTTEEIPSYVAGTDVIGVDSSEWMGANTLSYVDLIDQYLPLELVPVTNTEVCPSQCDELFKKWDDDWNRRLNSKSKKFRMSDDE